MLGCNYLARSRSRSLSLFFVFLSFDYLSRVCSFLTPLPFFPFPIRLSFFFFVRYPADVGGWRYVQEHRQSLEGARVSFEAVDTRAGRAWWQCLLCDPEIATGGLDVDSDSISEGEEDSFAAAVDNVKPEVWMNSDHTSSFARTLDGDPYRSQNRDVCSIM